jgi:outer membrane protein
MNNFTLILKPMKHFKTLLLSTFLFLTTAVSMQAQSKVAHVDTQQLIESMPQYKEAQKQLEQWAKTYESEIKELAAALQTKLKQYDQEAESKTDEENAERYKEVQDMQKNIREYQVNAQKDMQEKELDLLKPITDKAKEAILKVARAQGFDYVLNSTQGNGVIMADGKDLMADVQKELGY